MMAKVLRALLRRPAWGWRAGLAAGLVWVGLVPAAGGADPPPPAWDNFSDTWVATDGLGRSSPDAAQAGPARSNKTVGIFYFLWLGHHGKTLYDITKILAASPDQPRY